MSRPPTSLGHGPGKTRLHAGRINQEHAQTQSIAKQESTVQREVAQTETYSDTLSSHSPGPSVAQVQRHRMNPPTHNTSVSLHSTTAASTGRLRTLSMGRVGQLDLAVRHGQCKCSVSSCGVQELVRGELGDERWPGSVLQGPTRGSHHKRHCSDKQQHHPRPSKH